MSRTHAHACVPIPSSVCVPVPDRPHALAYTPRQHHLTSDFLSRRYIFELSGKFNQFYEQCPVLAAETAELQRSRLALCSLTASVLRLSLGLLGIDTLERL